MLKKEPFKESRRGAVFAVRIAPDRWGFVRFRTHSGLGVLPFYSRSAGMPKIDWSDNVEKWFAREMSGAEEYDTEDFVLLGERRFSDAERSGMPDTYQAPQHPWQPWIVYRGNTIVHVQGPEDVLGMQVHRFINAGMVRQLITEKYEAGELQEVQVEPIRAT